MINLFIKLTRALFWITSLLKSGIVVADVVVVIDLVVVGFVVVDLVVIGIVVICCADVDVAANNSKLVFLR